MRNNLLLLTGIAGLLAATAPASALSMKECSAKYQAAKQTGTTTKWNDFRKAECSADASLVPATAAAPPVASSAPTVASTRPQLDRRRAENVREGVTPGRLHDVSVGDRSEVFVRERREGPHAYLPRQLQGCQGVGHAR